MSTAALELESPPITFEGIIRDKLKPDVQRIDHEGFYPETFMREYGEAGAFYPVTEPGNFYQAIENCSLYERRSKFYFAHYVQSGKCIPTWTKRLW